MRLIDCEDLFTQKITNTWMVSPGHERMEELMDILPHLVAANIVNNRNLEELLENSYKAACLLRDAGLA